VAAKLFKINNIENIAKIFFLTKDNISVTFWFFSIGNYYKILPMPLKRKIAIIFLLLFSCFSGLYGGFKQQHVDTEFEKTLYNKSYFLHTLYKIPSSIEFNIYKSKNPKFEKYNLKTFQSYVAKHSISLYTVNGFFILLGIYSCFNLCFLLKKDFWLAYLASIILASCYFWNAEAHYPTTDMPLSALILFFFYRLFKYPEKTNSNAIILGCCFSIKYIGLILIIPYLFFRRKQNHITTLKNLLIAFCFLLISMGDKLTQILSFLKRELIVQTQEGWAGYNTQEPSYIYHLKFSIIQEYGLLLSLLAIIGLVYCFKYLKNKDEELKTICIFFITLFITISLSMIHTVRFALPLIPFMAIFSAIGIFYCFQISKPILKQKSNIFFVVLTLFAIVPSSLNTIKHNSLMNQPDTIDFIKKIRQILHKNNIKEQLLHLDHNLFDKTPQNNVLYNNKCFSEAKDFKEYFKLNNNSLHVVNANSFQLDRFIHDPFFQCSNGHKAFDNFADLQVLQISPFKISKDKVPFSFISNFSPRKPDLQYRNYQGALFEIYYTNNSLDQELKAICKKENLPCAFKTGKDSYFLNNLQVTLNKKLN